MIELSEKILKEKTSSADQVKTLEEKNRINNEEAAMFEEQLRNAGNLGMLKFR